MYTTTQMMTQQQKQALIAQHIASSQQTRPTDRVTFSKGLVDDTNGMNNWSPMSNGAQDDNGNHALHLASMSPTDRLQYITDHQREVTLGKAIADQLQQQQQQQQQQSQLRHQQIVEVRQQNQLIHQIKQLQQQQKSQTDQMQRQRLLQMMQSNPQSPIHHQIHSQIQSQMQMQSQQQNQRQNQQNQMQNQLQSQTDWAAAAMAMHGQHAMNGVHSQHQQHQNQNQNPLTAAAVQQRNQLNATDPTSQFVNSSLLEMKANLSREKAKETAAAQRNASAFQYGANVVNGIPNMLSGVNGVGSINGVQSAVHPVTQPAVQSSVQPAVQSVHGLQAMNGMHPQIGQSVPTATTPMTPGIPSATGSAAALNATLNSYTPNAINSNSMKSMHSMGTTPQSAMTPTGTPLTEQYLNHTANTVNTVNSMHSVNSMNSTNGINGMNGMNAMQMNSMNTMNAGQTTYIQTRSSIKNNLAGLPNRNFLEISPSQFGDPSSIIRVVSFNVMPKNADFKSYGNSPPKQCNTPSPK